MKTLILMALVVTLTGCGGAARDKLNKMNASSREAAKTICYEKYGVTDESSLSRQLEAYGCIFSTQDLIQIKNAETVAKQQLSYYLK